MGANPSASSVPDETPDLRSYEGTDQAGFEALVSSVHREFGLAHHPGLDRDLARPDLHYWKIWVLIHDQNVAGTAALTAPVDGVTTLKRMYLRADLRGDGWGRRLLNRCLDAARQEGCRRVILDTMDRQQAAWSMYEKAGFHLETRRGGMRYYGLDLTAGR